MYKKMMKDFNVIHPKTKWELICSDIEMKIIRGDLKSTDKVSSISELADEYNVSKTTAQKTLEKLCEAGIVSKRKGVGYFVLPYSKEKLRKKHLEILEEKISDFLSYAKDLKFDNNEVLNIVSRFLK